MKQLWFQRTLKEDNMFVSFAKKVLWGAENYFWPLSVSGVFSGMIFA